MDLVKGLIGLDPAIDVHRHPTVRDLGLSVEVLRHDMPEVLRESMRDIAELAARMLGMPIALVSLVDGAGQLVPACAVEPGREPILGPGPLEDSFCAWAIKDPDRTMVIRDATLDPRFAGMGPVTSAPHIRFYAGRPFRSPSGQPVGALCVIDDQPRQGLSEEDEDTLQRLVRMLETQLHLAATNRLMEATHRSSAAVVDRERRFLHAVLDNLGDSVVACDASGTLTVFNPAARVVHGLPAEPLQPDRWAEHYDLYRADGHTPLPTEEIPLFRALAGHEVVSDEIVIAPNGRPPRRMTCQGQQLIDAEGTLLGAVVAMHDVTVQRDAEARLRYMADHDPLTGMPNRNALQRDLDELIATQRDRRAAVLFLDLDGFKAINDAHGHVVGDRVLTAVADRIRGVTLPSDVIARLGGDEFVVVRAGADSAAATDLAMELARAVERPLMGRGGLIDPRASIGIATIPTLGGSSVDRIMDLGDRAMYAVKRHRRGAVNRR